MSKQEYIKPYGFTLLELILVMLILSTVLALAGPSLRGFFASRKTQDAAAQILALTQWARSRAISDGDTVRLNFDERENSYWLTIQRGGDYERLKTEIGRTFFLPQGTEFKWDGIEENGDEAHIAFDPQATVTAGTVQLIDRRGYVVQLVCESPTETYVIEVLNEDESRRAL